MCGDHASYREGAGVGRRGRAATEYPSARSRSPTFDTSTCHLQQCHCDALTSMSAVLEHMPHHQPATEVNCRLGYTEHHAVFALLHFALHICFYSSRHRVPRPLWILCNGSSALAIGFRVLLGGMCSSPRVTAAVHTQFTTSPLAQIRLVFLFVNGLLNSAVAGYIVKFNLEGAGQAARLVILSVPVLLAMLALAWWCTHAITEPSLKALHLKFRSMG